jgi:hypothetical protein
MKKFSELRKQVRADPERAARVQAYKASLLAELSLAEIRRARQVTQGEVAATLNTTQSAVSRLEHQADLYLSTLKKYIEAIGGRLQIMAEFPDATIPIDAFATLGDDLVQRTWSRLQLAVQHGPLPALGERQAALPLAAASEVGEQPYYVYERVSDGELLATISRRLRGDELLLEWVHVPEHLEGARVHVRVETAKDQSIEADIYPVASGLECVLAKGQRLAPTALSRVTLEFGDEP